MRAFAKKEGVKYSCLKLEKTDDDNYIIAIEQAVEDVKFIIFVGTLSNVEDESIKENIHGVYCAEEQSSFLTGYVTGYDFLTLAALIFGQRQPLRVFKMFSVSYFGIEFVNNLMNAVLNDF